MKPVFYFVIITVAGALIWTATADWYEKKKGLGLVGALNPQAGPGPAPSVAGVSF